MLKSESFSIVKVTLNQANIVVNEIKKLKLINPNYQITEDNGFLLIPLKKITPKLENLEKTYHFGILESYDLSHKLKKRAPKQRKTLKNALISEIPHSLLELIPRSFDIIGNVAII